MCNDSLSVQVERSSGSDSSTAFIGSHARKTPFPSCLFPLTQTDVEMLFALLSPVYYRSCGFSSIALVELRIGGYKKVDHLDIAVRIHAWLHCRCEENEEVIICL